MLNTASSSEPESKSGFQPIDRSLELLREALSLVDAEGWPAEIGARLDHVICSIEGLKEQLAPPS